MKKVLLITIILSFTSAQQGLNLKDLEPGTSGKLMYPYSGKVFDYWPYGDVRVRGRLRNGLRNGKWEFFHTNGSKMAVGKYFDGDGSDIDPETKIKKCCEELRVQSQLAQSFHDLFGRRSMKAKGRPSL